MSIVFLEDRIVHYEVLGRGRPIIFLHGWVGSWRYWVPCMQAASTAYRAYAIDLWGFGDTSHVPGRYRLETQADLLNLFMQAMGIGRIALIGHGLGALAGILFARRFPDLVDRLMAINIPLTITVVNSRLRSPVSPTDLADWLLSKDPLNDAVRIDAPKADPFAITSSFDDLNGRDFLPIMEGLRTPCLIVHGQNDTAVQPPDYERVTAMADHIHQIVFEDSGHFPMLDESAKFNHLVADFLGLVSGESPRQLRLKEEWKRRVR